MSQQGVIFDIQRFTISDGPGMRTEVFLKGCPLRCRWCSNPEGLSQTLQPGVYSAKCIARENCGDCLTVCAHDALVFSEGKLSVIDREKCAGCFRCAEACPADAIRKWGEVMSVADCMEIIRRDKVFYDRSGGGVTLSGGEPLMQSDFAAQLLRACEEEGFHTCCDTALQAKWENVEQILPYTDLIISDIRMPGMRGDDFLEWIKQNELFRNIPVIMLSSEDSTSERIRLLEIGAVDYIVKPFNPMELKIRVKKILPNE